MQKLLVCLCVGQSHGVGEGVGAGGVPGNFQNWVQHIDGCVGAGGCTYVCMLHTYIRTYVFVIKISDLDPHILTKYVGHHFKTLSPQYFKN